MTGAAPAASRPVGLRPRSFLFLQGPLSRFFEELGRALIARGHRVHRVDLHLGEQLFWRLPATHFRGRFDEWREFIAGVLDAHQVTDMILVGDRRPYHLVATEEARLRGVAVTCTDFGYLRPGWITFEPDGMTTYSRFPRDPAAIRKLAAGLPALDLSPRYNPPFRLVAALDVAFTVPQVLGRPLYPHYRWHGIYHPFAEYAGWLAALVRRNLTAGATATAKLRLARQPGSYFLFPLQLATDFQIRGHSPFADARDAVREVVASYVASGSGRKLVVVAHPLDNGLINWRRLVERVARGSDAAERVIVFEGGVPPPLLDNAAGIVTVNSTIGISALYEGLPVKALGSAIFDIPGMTDQGPLDDFWHDPAPPDRKLVEAFVRALAGTTQLRGGFHERAAKACAISGIVERLEREHCPLPPLGDAELARRRVRPSTRTVVIAGAARGLGLALARAYAAPGTRLYLVGGSAAGLATAAGDCLRRGAEIEVAAMGPAGLAAIASRIDEIDRHAALDLVIASAEDLDLPAAEARTVRARDLLAALAANGVGERMRRRRRGRIAIIGGLAGRVEPARLPSYAIGEAGLLAYAAGLAQRSAGAPLISVACAGRLAVRLAGRGANPRLVAVNADRAAECIRRGIERGRSVIAFPGPATIAWRAVRLAPGWLREWRRRAALAADRADKVTLSGESTQGD